LTHAPLQAVDGEVQLGPAEHAPLLQVWPVPHTFPQVPQLNGLVLSASQIPPQLDW
jgi:hypothetical protein